MRDILTCYPFYKYSFPFTWKDDLNIFYYKVKVYDRNNKYNLKEVCFDYFGSLLKMHYCLSSIGTADMICRKLSRITLTIKVLNKTLCVQEHFKIKFK